MKTREIKQKDLTALTESLSTSKSAMVVSFTKLTVTKDQEFRSSLREAGAQYQVVKNTLARIAVKGTQLEDASEHFKGVTAIAWTENDPVVLSKAISKFMKDNAEIYSFKTGVVDGKLVDLQQLTTIANLPSKEELISKLMWVLNSGAQRLVTVISAVPRDLAVVIKQIGEAKPAADQAVKAEAQAAEKIAAAPDEPETESEVSPEAPTVVVAADVPVIEAAPTDETADAPADLVAEPAEDVPAADIDATPAAEPEAETEVPATEAESEGAAAAPDDKAEESLEPASEAQSPDDKGEEVLETLTEAEAEEKT